MDAPLQAIIDAVSSLRGLGLYAIVAGLAFGGTAIGLDLIVPEEIGLFLAGAAAARGDASLAVMIVAGFAGAVLGDSVSYAIGRRWGVEFIRRSRLARRFLEPKIHGAQVYFERRGGPAIFFGRWVGALRAVVPMVAGIGGMPFPRFLLWNLVASAIWVSVVLSTGYLLGSFATDVFGQATLVVGIVVGSGFLLAWLAALAKRHHGQVVAGVTWILRSPPACWAARHYGAQLRWLAQRLDPRLAHGLGLTMSAAIVFLAALIVVVTIPEIATTGGLVPLDEPVLRWFVSHRTDEVVTVAQRVVSAASLPWIGVVAAAVAVVLAVFTRLRFGIRTAIGSAGTIGLVLILEEVIRHSLATATFAYLPVAVVVSLTVHTAFSLGGDGHWVGGIVVATVGAFLLVLVTAASLLVAESTLAGIAIGLGLAAAWSGLVEAQARMPFADPVNR